MSRRPDTSMARAGLTLVDKYVGALEREQRYMKVEPREFSNEHHKLVTMGISDLDSPRGLHTACELDSGLMPARPRSH